MIGGFSTPKKDRNMKVSGGQAVKTGEILCRGLGTYKAGKNVGGAGTLYAQLSGAISFTRKKTSKGKIRTFINIIPSEKK